MSDDNTPLGDRMKAYEHCWRTRLPRRTYTIIRVDGKAFHTLLRTAERPFDGTFMFLMSEVAVKMCREIPGTVFAYLQSDEISFLLTDFDSIGTEPWFGGVLQKIVSISAAMASDFFSFGRTLFPGVQWAAGGGPSIFDSRVFTIPDAVEVGNYFIWRQRDAVRNSIQMAAQAHFLHDEIQHLNGDQLQEKLFTDAGVNWNNYPDSAKRGTVVTRKAEVVVPDDESPAYRRWQWSAAPAPHFVIKMASFLPNHVPVLPPMPATGEDLLRSMGRMPTEGA